MIIHDKAGGRTVQLFIPFDYQGRKIESVTISAVRFGHVILWNEGNWKTVVSLLSELASVDEAVIRELRYPDADRVMEAFMSMLPAAIRSDVEDGRVPVKSPEDGTEEFRRAMNGSGEPIDHEDETPQGPGAPLPPMGEGFDMSEEP